MKVLIRVEKNRNRWKVGNKGKWNQTQANTKRTTKEYKERIMEHFTANDMYETMKGVKLNSSNSQAGNRETIAKQTKYLREDIIDSAVSTILLHCREYMLKGCDSVDIDLSRIPLYINSKNEDLVLNGQNFFREEIIQDALREIMNLGYTLTKNNGLLKVSWAEAGKQFPPHQAIIIKKRIAYYDLVVGRFPVDENNGETNDAL